MTLEVIKRAGLYTNDARLQDWRSRLFPLYSLFRLFDSKALAKQPDPRLFNISCGTATSRLPAQNLVERDLSKLQDCKLANHHYHYLLCLHEDVLSLLKRA